MALIFSLQIISFVVIYAHVKFRIINVVSDYTFAGKGDIRHHLRELPVTTI